MIGEWTGVSADANILVTLQVGPPGKTRLAIAEADGSSVSTKVYGVKNLQVRDGQFSIAGPGEQVTFKGTASKTWSGRGAGTGKLVLNGGRQGQREIELYLFYSRDKWIEQILDMARRYRLL